MRRLRAVSPVVAVLLLILVAVGAVVLMYLWLTGFAGKSTQTPATLQAQYRIEAAKIYPNPGQNATIELYLRNTGRTSIDLVTAREQNALAVYIYDSYTGDLVYSNITALGITTFSSGVFAADYTYTYNDTTTNTTVTIKVPVVRIYDDNHNGVWEPGELLYVMIRHLAFTSNPQQSTLYIDGTTLACGHYYDITIVLSGQKATVSDVRVSC